MATTTYIKRDAIMAFDTWLDSVLSTINSEYDPEHPEYFEINRTISTNGKYEVRVYYADCMYEFSTYTNVPQISAAWLDGFSNLAKACEVQRSPRNYNDVLIARKE